MAKSADKVTIKKYANRRLYDTESSSYITLDRLAAMIREGRDFEVVDAKTGEDITHQVLTQIIVDEESRGSTHASGQFPSPADRPLRRADAGGVPPYLEAAMDAFQKNQRGMAGAFGRKMLFADLAKRNMAMFEEATRKLQPPLGDDRQDGRRHARMNACLPGSPDPCHGSANR